MLEFIDKKLDTFFDKDSCNYMNRDIWNEIFKYLESIKEDKPLEYSLEVKRCRDIKNSIDTAYQDGIKSVSMRTKNN
jgi:hypothetical protein